MHARRLIEVAVMVAALTVAGGQYEPLERNTTTGECSQNVEFTGVIEVPSGTNPTTDEAGEIALDTSGDGSTVTQGVLEIYDGTRTMFFYGSDAYPGADNYILKYDAALHKLAWEADSDTGLSFDGDTDGFVDANNGGTDQDSSGWTGWAKITAGTWSAASLAAGTDYSRTGVVRNLWIDAGAMISRTTNGAASATVESTTAKEMSDFFDFDAAADEFVCVRVALPDEWNLGTIKAKVYWTAASGSDDVVWGVQGIALSEGDAIDTAYGTAKTVTDTITTANDVHVSAATAAITIGGTPALGDVIYVQVYRDADAVGDTCAVDARLIGIMLQYTESATEPSAW